MSAIIHGLFTCLILQNLTGACLLQILKNSFFQVCQAILISSQKNICLKTEELLRSSKYNFLLKFLYFLDRLTLCEFSL